MWQVLPVIRIAPCTNEYMKNSELLEFMLAERGWVCEEKTCRHKDGVLQCHHWLFGDRRANKKLHDLLTQKYNCGIVCCDCHHTRKVVNTDESRMRFLADQIERYGKKAMQNFIGLCENEGLYIENWLKEV
jgi:hypothetical protein